MDDEFGDRDEVDREEDSMGPPNSISSVLTWLRIEFVFDVLDGDGRFLRGIVDGTCLISIVIAVSQLKCLPQQFISVPHSLTIATKFV